MKIVVDCNKIIASFIKVGTTRSLLLNSYFNFVAPEFIKVEIEKYKETIIKKAKISEGQFKIVLSLFFESVTIISEEEYKNEFNKVKNLISDPKDIPYFACCISSKADGIWSHDSDFIEQNEIRIFTNSNLLRML